MSFDFTGHSACQAHIKTWMIRAGDFCNEICKNEKFLLYY